MNSRAWKRWLVGAALAWPAGVILRAQPAAAAAELEKKLEELRARFPTAAPNPLPEEMQKLPPAPPVPWWQKSSLHPRNVVPEWYRQAKEKIAAAEAIAKTLGRERFLESLGTPKEREKKYQEAVGAEVLRQNLANRVRLAVPPGPFTLGAGPMLEYSIPSLDGPPPVDELTRGAWERRAAAAVDYTAFARLRRSEEAMKRTVSEAADQEHAHVMAAVADGEARYWQAASVGDLQGKEGNDRRPLRAKEWAASRRSSHWMRRAKSWYLDWVFAAPGFDFRDDYGAVVQAERPAPRLESTERLVRHLLELQQLHRALLDRSQSFAYWEDDKGFDLHRTHIERHALAVLACLARLEGFPNSFWPSDLEAVERGMHDLRRREPAWQEAAARWADLKHRRDTAYEANNHGELDRIDAQFPAAGAALAALVAQPACFTAPGSGRVAYVAARGHGQGRDSWGTSDPSTHWPTDEIVEGVPVEVWVGFDGEVTAPDIRIEVSGGAEPLVLRGIPDPDGRRFSGVTFPRFLVRREARPATDVRVVSAATAPAPWARFLAGKWTVRYKDRYLGDITGRATITPEGRDGEIVFQHPRTGERMVQPVTAIDAGWRAVDELARASDGDFAKRFPRGYPEIRMTLAGPRPAAAGPVLTFEAPDRPTRSGRPPTVDGTLDWPVLRVLGDVLTINVVGRNFTVTRTLKPANPPADRARAELRLSVTSDDGAGNVKLAGESAFRPDPLTWRDAAGGGSIGSVRRLWENPNQMFMLVNETWTRPILRPQVQLIAQTELGPVKVPRLYVGVPTIVEAVYRDPQEDEEREITVAATGGEQRVTIRRDPGDWRRFTSDEIALGGGVSL